MKKVTVSFVGAYLPDYFGGHHLPVLQAPVDGATTRESLYGFLLNELNLGVIDYQINELGGDYDDVRKAIKDCLYFNDQCKPDDLVFPDLDVWDNLESDEDTVFAFFVVDIEKEE